jgi:hypothetical protein
MYYLIYMSSAVRPMTYDELSALLKAAREKNRQLGITGMLLYQRGTFLQLLEGDKTVVNEVFDSISKDSRHTGIHVVHTGNIAERNFSDWSMGFVNMDKAGEYPAFSDYIDEKLALTSFRDDALEAYRFIVLFNQLNQ